MFRSRRNLTCDDGSNTSLCNCYNARARFFAPFIIRYAIVFFFVLALLFVLIEIGIIHHAFLAVGLPPELALTALFASLIGSYINIPLSRIERGPTHPTEIVNSFGMRYRVPMRYAG